MQNYININSKLYAELFSEGGDSLVAVYAMLKFAKRIENITKKKSAIKIYKEKNRNIYHTLKDKTNLSVTTLRKYIKELQKLELCRFDSVGNFVLVGVNKINKRYCGLRRPKRVPIEVGTFSETKLFSFRVRIIRAEQIQKNRIDRRYEQNKVIGRISKGYRLSQKEINFKDSWNDSDLTYAEDRSSFNAKTVMSNYGFSKLKFGETKTKSNGFYWKKKLVGAGIIKTRRKFKYLRKCTYKEYRELKFNVDISLMYSEGKLFRELIPEFTTTNFPVKEKVEKLDYLQFDFCHFLSEQ